MDQQQLKPQCSVSQETVNNEVSGSCQLQQYHKLIKMKKLLAETEKKMNNRIRLFENASQKILKKKQNELKVYEKLESIKKDPTFVRTKLSRKLSKENISSLFQPKRLSQSHSQSFKESRCSKQTLVGHPRRSEEIFNSENETNRKILAEKINETRIQNVKSIKEDRQRNKIIIEQRKKKELRKKLQSANLIRRERENVKSIKERILKEKQEDFRLYMESKYEREKEDFEKIQSHLSELQKQQRQALINWKKTIAN